MKDFEIKLIKKQDLKGSIVVKGVPGVGSISHISVDYLINKLKAELVCKIYSNYFPNIVLINDDSTIEQPHYQVYYKKVGVKKLVFIKNNYPPTTDYYSYITNSFMADLIKKWGSTEVITIAGIAYKQMPKKIKLYGATNDKKLQKKLSKKDIIFNGNKSVGLIIGSAGLLLSQCAERKIPGFCVLASTWAYPNYVGIKESKKTLEFLADYLGFKLDFSDLNKEIKNINEQTKKVKVDQKSVEESAELNKGRYIG